MRKRKILGFTLDDRVRMEFDELLVVIAVIAILLMFIVPAINMVRNKVKGGGEGTQDGYTIQEAVDEPYEVEVTEPQLPEAVQNANGDYEILVDGVPCIIYFEGGVISIRKNE